MSRTTLSPVLTQAQPRRRWNSPLWLERGVPHCRLRRMTGVRGHHRNAAECQCRWCGHLHMRWSHLRHLIHLQLPGCPISCRTTTRSLRKTGRSWKSLKKGRRSNCNSEILERRSKRVVRDFVLLYLHFLIIYTKRDTEPLLHRRCMKLTLEPRGLTLLFQVNST